MVQVLCKIWGLGMFSILVLATSNIFLTLRLLHTSDTVQNCDSQQSKVPQKSWTDALKEGNHSEYMNFLRRASIVVEEREKGTANSDEWLQMSGEESSRGKVHTQHRDESVLSIDPRLGRFDDRRLFKIFDKVFTGPNYVNYVEVSPVTLATQSSVDRMYWLTQVSRYWENAPISLAIFTPDVEYGLARIYLKYLLTCFPMLGNSVSVHFVYPKQYPPKSVNIVLDNLHELCDKPLVVLKSLLKQRSRTVMKWRETMQYPQNLLRNVARKNCATEWVFLTDVDIIPIPGLSRDVSYFLRSREASQCLKCAFVIPTYELDESSPLPSNRALLLDLVAKGKARPFHQKVFVYNQHATNFTRWESREKEFGKEKEVAISHNVTDFEFFYEPFYIARDSVPPHDERFLGYGFTRNTQVYETYVAGFSFRVLSPIFTLHWGMQAKKDRPAWRERQNSGNRKLMEGFKREVFARYQKDPLGMMNTKRIPKRSSKH